MAVAMVQGTAVVVEARATPAARAVATVIVVGSLATVAAGKEEAPYISDRPHY